LQRQALQLYLNFVVQLYRTTKNKKLWLI